MAAGMGSRFGNKTKDKPKGFIEFKGRSMIERSIEILLNNGIEKIIIGTGYQNEFYDQLASNNEKITCVFSEKFADTNSMYTLWKCKEEIASDDFLLLESDLIFEDKAIKSLIESEYKNALLCSEVIKFQDSYYIEYNNENDLTFCSVNEAELDIKGELVGIHKLSNNYYCSLCETFEKLMEDEPKQGYEYTILKLAKEGKPIKVLQLDNLLWYEIDDDNDLEFAEKNINIS